MLVAISKEVPRHRIIALQIHFDIYDNFSLVNLEVIIAYIY